MSINREKIEENLRLHVDRLAGLIGPRTLEQAQNDSGHDRLHRRPVVRDGIQPNRGMLRRDGRSRRPT